MDMWNIFYLLASLAFSAGYAVQYGVRGRIFVPSVLGATLAWYCLGLGERYLGSVVFANFLAASFVSLWAVIWSRRKKAPSTIFLIIGVLPLVPGRSIYLTMVALVERRLMDALSLLVETIGISFAITIGILFITTTYSLIRVILSWNKTARKEKIDSRRNRF